MVRQSGRFIDYDYNSVSFQAINVQSTSETALEIPDLSSNVRRYPLLRGSGLNEILIAGMSFHSTDEAVLGQTPTPTYTVRIYLQTVASPNRALLTTQTFNINDPNYILLGDSGLTSYTDEGYIFRPVNTVVDLSPNISGWITVSIQCDVVTTGALDIAVNLNIRRS